MSKNVNPAIERYASLLIQKIKEVEASKWKKPWITSTLQRSPRNLDGREYSQLNKLLLFLITEEHKYKTPVFLTFRQAERKSLHILKGSKSFPVTYYDFTVKHRLTGDKITIDEYRQLPEKAKKEYIAHPFLKFFNVFNLDQTNFSDKYPERWNSLLSEFTEDKTIITDGYSLPVLDFLVDKQKWVCPIHLKSQNEAYYSKSTDIIVLPVKEQFPEGTSFYNTLLHEMAHSTGYESRLNRPKHIHEGDSIYAREELIAELTAALTGKDLGIHTQPQQANAQYISSWLSALQENPQYIMTLLQDVSKASQIIIQNTIDMNKEQEAWTDHIPSTERLKDSSIINDIDNRISNINIFSLKEGGMGIKCKVDDIQYSSVKLEKDDLLAFSDTSNRNLLASKYYKDELNGCPSKRAELCTTDTRTLSAQVTLNNKRIIEVNNPMITEKLTGSSSQLDTKGIKLNSLTGSQMKDLLSGKTVSGIAGISGYLGLNKTPAGWTLSIGKKIINTADSEAEI